MRFVVVAVGLLAQFDFVGVKAVVRHDAVECGLVGRSDFHNSTASSPGSRMRFGCVSSTGFGRNPLSIDSA